VSSLIQRESRRPQPSGVESTAGGSALPETLAELPARAHDRLVHHLRARCGLVLLAAAAALVVGEGVGRADIYQYIDADGVLHFTNQPQAKNGKAPWKLYAKSKDAPSQGKLPPGWTPRPFGGGGVERYTRYDEIIHAASGYYQLPEAFVRAIIKTESDFDPTALSVAGAQGLMQLMPETASHLQVTDAWDPRENIYGGCRYLRILANMFNGDLDLTIAAYNAGEGAVIRAGGIPNIAETQDYVVKVKAWYRRYRALDPVEASVGSGGADKTGSGEP
jgi:soluble lytic murein transglycosylase-like protein